MAFTIVVPARNEAATIAEVLSAIRDLTDDLVVVDGNSTDGTGAIAQSFGARVVRDHGRGKGDAVRLGLEVARHPITVMIDADGSHDPRDIPSLVGPIARDEADLVMGSRMLGGSEELFGSISEVIRLMGSLVISLSINYRFGVRLTDYQNGFRAIRTSVGRSIGLTSDITTIEQEMAMKCLRHGYRVTEVPTHESRRKGGVTKINVMRVAHVYVWSLIRGIVVRRRPAPPSVPVLAAGWVRSSDGSGLSGEGSITSRTMRWRLMALGPPAAGCGITLVAGWPGGISPDMATTLSEAQSFAFHGSQSPMFGLLWALPLAILPLPAAVGIGYVLQSVAYWSLFALLADAAIRRQRPILGLVAALAGFLPPLFGFTVMLESNVQTATAWGLAVALAFAWPHRRSLAFCLALLFYGYIARYGMTAALPPIVFACLALSAPQTRWTMTLKKTVLVTLIFATAALGVTAVVPGSPTRTAQLGVSRLVDLAGVYQRTGTHCIPDAFVPPTTTAETIMATYDPSLAAQMIWVNPARFQLPEDEAAYEPLRECWMETLQTYPREYLAVKARFALIFLMVGEEWAPATRPDYSANARLSLSTPDHRLARATAEYVERSRTSVVWKGWFWLTIAGLSVALAAALAHPYRAAAAGLYFAALGVLAPQFLAGQASLARYFVPLILLCLLCLLVIAIGRRTRRPGAVS